MRTPLPDTERPALSPPAMQRIFTMERRVFVLIVSASTIGASGTFFITACDGAVAVARTGFFTEDFFMVVEAARAIGREEVAVILPLVTADVVAAADLLPEIG